MARKTRKLFEDVGDAGSVAAPPCKNLIDGSGAGARRAVRVWLMALFALVVVMIAVGGLTRLTDSGLSITEWRPVTGALPPISAEAWEAEFAKYRESPEYRIVNEGMELAAFKVIYWWEWGHRQLGRVIGLVWAAGFAGFLIARKVPPGWTGRLLLLGALGGLQGAIGWWMVSSGLVDGRTDVASYRLAVHLGLAFAILGLISWYVLLLGRDDREIMTARRGRDAALFGLATGLMHLTMVQILLGALVAGIDAGRSFTDWPLMAGQVFPGSAFDIEPLWRNFFENPALVQFIHRVSGYLVALFAVAVWLKGRRSANRATARAVDWVLVAVLVQVAIGVVTVLYAAPWQVALLHQFTAVIVWSLVIRARFLALYPRVQTLRGSA